MPSCPNCQRTDQWGYEDPHEMRECPFCREKHPASLWLGRNGKPLGDPSLDALEDLKPSPGERNA